MLTVIKNMYSVLLFVFDHQSHHQSFCLHLSLCPWLCDLHHSSCILIVVLLSVCALITIVSSSVFLFTFFSVSIDVVV